MMKFSIPTGCSLYLLVLLVIRFVTEKEAISLHFDSGCADGTREGLHIFEQIAACGGEWEGHVANAGHLCAPKWNVCSHQDKTLLKMISWQDATEFGGCFAFNAAQDGGNCHECSSHLEKDDLAAVGHGCPHQNFGQTSCITGGKIDASCCVDTLVNKSCIYQPGLMTGVLCCHRGDDGANSSFLHRENLWYATGTTMNHGCARGVAESLSHLETVRGCSGRWLGHVRNGRSLCAKGWHVCSPRDQSALHSISWDDVINTEGCYAFNAANMPTRCSRCHRKHIAGVGKNCEFKERKGAQSCLKHGFTCIIIPPSLKSGHVTVTQNKMSGCSCIPGITSGVLCCKKQRHRHKHVVCSPKCSHKGTCITPGICKCRKGYTGKTCNIRLRHRRCRMPCYNGGKCRRGKCRCSKLFQGKSCHHGRRLWHVWEGRLNEGSSPPAWIEMNFP